MNNFSKASALFDTTFDPSEYFESLSAETTKNLLVQSVSDKKAPLIFLLGESGVGKTYMLNVVQNILDKKRFLFATDPFSTPESFLHFLLLDFAYDKDLNLLELKEKVIEIYKNEDIVVIIDEAQLLNETVLEFIRILSDTSYFTFVLSMHKQEGEEILKKQHFLSRNHRVITLEKLSDYEISKYIASKLLKNNLGELGELFQKKQIKYIQKFSQGNFRNTKQILKHTFSIMDYALSNNHKKYITPTKYVITMSAIDLGLLDV